MANLMAFQSLLHQCRYATTFLMSRLMSPPCRTQCETRVRIQTGEEKLGLTHDRRAGNSQDTEISSIAVH